MPTDTNNVFTEYDQSVLKYTHQSINPDDAKELLLLIDRLANQLIEAQTGGNLGKP